MKTEEIIATIDQHLEKLVLVKPDAARVHVHYYADFVELAILLSKGLVYSTSEITDLFKDAGIFKQREKSSDQAGENDENEKFVNAVFRVIEDRAYYYKDSYPFEVVSRVAKLKSKQSTQQKVYLYLLISSNLNLFHKYYVNLTTDFEVLAYEVVRNFMPSSAEIRQFGKRKDEEFSTRAVDKIPELARLIRIPIDDEQLSRISPLGKEERGLDVVSWLPFDDEVGNKFIFLVQCTCEKEWYKKQSETRRYNGYFNFYKIKPYSAMCIPYALIDFQRPGFHEGDSVDNTLIFERKRLLDNLEELDFFEALPSNLIVNSCLNKSGAII